MAEKRLTAEQELEQLRAENAALKAKAAKTKYFKVSEKGAVSYYGMRRFPVTFYKDEWLELLDKADELRTFIKDNESSLKGKE